MTAMLDQISRSPRAARTRSALIDAGLELLAVKPIDAIPIDEVVALASVAKGSFFNHFADKPAFAAALAAEVRLELEEQVGRANQDVEDPVERIARGFVVCAGFASANRKQAAVLLRSISGVSERSHPLNKGIAKDFDDAARQGLISGEARASGVLFWLGLCQAFMAYLVESDRAPCEAQKRASEMLVLGLTGLGIDRQQVESVADRAGELAHVTMSTPVPPNSGAALGEKKGNI